MAGNGCEPPFHVDECPAGARDAITRANERSTYHFLSADPMFPLIGSACRSCMQLNVGRGRRRTRAAAQAQTKDVERSRDATRRREARTSLSISGCVIIGARGRSITKLSRGRAELS